jgi:uncharacterized protein involved in outer membrane biogenesis
VNLLSSKRRIAVAAALLVLALFLLRPGASRLKSRIIFSISSAVGRPVDIGSVHLRLLPRPGFDLENLVVYDDASFGAEPMLRAGEVTAVLRLTSLLRGRLEIARLDLTEPSLNLVHADSGRWNLEALLERTAHMPLAPTGKPRLERRPGFPYIEATSARINFKSGAEKKNYALTNADFSLWQDSENSWGVRLKAQPFRTDLNLNDMGVLQLSGAWQRADALRDAPLRFNVEWSRAQLGQFTKFFTGNDQGWRGEILLDATLTGTATDLQITSNGSIQDFRRYDISSGKPLRLAAQCNGAYSSLDHQFHGLACQAPVGNGLISLTGNAGLPGSRDYEFFLTAANVPARAAAVLVQSVKKNLPEDSVADGSLHGTLRLGHRSGSIAAPQFEGRGEITGLHLASAANKAEIAAETIPFVLTTSGTFASATGRSRQGSHRMVTSMSLPQGPHVEFDPISVAMGHLAPAIVRGWIDRGGYNISLVGEGEIAKIVRMARMFGFPPLQSVTIEGTAQGALQIAGSWAVRVDGAASNFSAPAVTGTGKLRNVRIGIRGVGGPIEIVSADVQVLPEEVRIARLNAKAADTLWAGSLSVPRACGGAAACQSHFTLTADQIEIGALREWASPSAKARPWYLLLEPNAKTGSSFLATVRASGELTTEHLQLPRLQATRVFAKVILDGGRLQISKLNADFLGGQHRGEWQADFSVKPAVCEGSGTVTGASLVDIADAMKDEWIAGTANARYEIKGPCPAEFWSSAEGTLSFDLRDGILPHILLGESAEPFKVASLVGQAQLHAGTIEIRNANLNSPEGRFELSGTSSLKGELDFKLAPTPNAPTPASYAITGTVTEPHVIRLNSPETQAKLKP